MITILNIFCLLVLGLETILVRRWRFSLVDVVGGVLLWLGALLPAVLRVSYYNGLRVWVMMSFIVSCTGSCIATICHFGTLIIRSVQFGSNRLWQFTATGRRDQLIDSAEPRRDNLPLRREGIGRRTWHIVEVVALECRIRLALDRSVEPSDLATRALVKKTVYGILSDRAEYPDLRKSDMLEICAIAAEVALTPGPAEIEALAVGSSAPMARNRLLARGAWGVMPTTWIGWFLDCLGWRAGPQYLGPVLPPSF